MPEAPWRVFGSKAFFRLWLAQVVSSTGDWIGLIAILAIAARGVRQLRRRSEPGDGHPGAARLPARHRRRRDHRPLRPTHGDGAVRRRPGRAPRDAAVRREPEWPAARVARPRDPHVDVGSGPGCVGAEPGARGAVVVGQLAVARRVVRHVPDRVDPLLAPRGGRDDPRRLRRDLVVEGRPGSAGADLRRVHVPRVGGDCVPPADPAARSQGVGAHRLDRDLPRDQGRAAVRVAAHARARRDARHGVRADRRGGDDPARPELRPGGARRRRRRVRCADDGAGLRCGHRCGHAVVAPGSAPTRRGVLLRGDRHRRVPGAGGVGVGARARRVAHRWGRRVRGHHLRHRLHPAAGERERRAAWSYVRHPLHGGAVVPPDLVDHLAVVGRFLGLGHRARCSTVRPSLSARTRTRCPGCASRCGVGASSRSSPGSWRGGRSAVRRPRRAPKEERRRR